MSLVLRLRFSIAGFAVDFLVPGRSLGNIVLELLKDHVPSRIAAPDDRHDAVIQLVPGDFGTEDQPVCLEEALFHGGKWVWGVPKAIDCWVYERVYYLILFPVLSRALAALHVARLHGALLYDGFLGVVLVLGARGAGKSTVTAACLEEGALVSSDDVILLRNCVGKVKCYGIHRELHIDPALADYLPGLRGLRDATEYLPGTGRLAYDWCVYRPDQCVEVLSPPTYILHSRINVNSPTSTRRLGVSELAALVDGTLAEIPENSILPRDVLASFQYCLKSAKGWEVTWGADIWHREGKHLAFLQSCLNR